MIFFVHLSSTHLRREINFVVPHHHAQRKKIYVIIMQGDKQEELPEFLLGTCRLNQLDVAKAVPINPS